MLSDHINPDSSFLDGKIYLLSSIFYLLCFLALIWFDFGFDSKLMIRLLLLVVFVCRDYKELFYGEIVYGDRF